MSRHPVILCGNCLTADLVLEPDDAFTCPACQFRPGIWELRSRCIFPDPARGLWYQACMTPAEGWFWGACLAEPPSWIGQVLAQAQIGPDRADFLLPAARIIIEVDGFSNHSSAADITRDRQRQRWLESQGYRLIRFSNTEVTNDPFRCVAEADALVLRYARGGTS